MAIEQLFEFLPLHHLQHGVSKFGAANVSLAVLVTIALGVLVDYAWMLYLGSKMVSPSGSLFVYEFLSLVSLLGPLRGRLLETPSSFLITSLGYTLNSSPRNTMRL